MTVRRKCPVCGNRFRDRPSTKVPFDRFYTERQTATMLNVTQEQLREWRHHGTAGSPPYILIAGLVRYAASDLREWQRDNRQTS